MANLLNFRTWRILLVRENSQTRVPQMFLSPSPIVSKIATAQKYFKNLSSLIFENVFNKSWTAKSWMSVETVKLSEVSFVNKLEKTWSRRVSKNTHIIGFSMNPLHAAGLFLYPLETSENLWLSDVSRWKRERLDVSRRCKNRRVGFC